MGRYTDVAGRLEKIAAELDDLSLDLLHEAVAEGATKRPDADRALIQARRAVEKAVMLLTQLDAPAAAGSSEG